jgi:hypothetical protein
MLMLEQSRRLGVERERLPLCNTASTRENSAAFRYFASSSAASFGATSCRNCERVVDAGRGEHVEHQRHARQGLTASLEGRRALPGRSGLSAMATMSAACSRMPSSNAGPKSSSVMASKRGARHGRPPLGTSSGLS